MLRLDILDVTLFPQDEVEVVSRLEIEALVNSAQCPTRVEASVATKDQVQAAIVAVAYDTSHSHSKVLHIQRIRAPLDPIQSSIVFEVCSEN